MDLDIQDSNEWFSADECLPEFNEYGETIPVLMCSEFGDMWVGIFVDDDDDIRFESIPNDEYMILNRIKFWRFLPDLPKKIVDNN